MQLYLITRHWIVKTEGTRAWGFTSVFVITIVDG